MLPSLATKSVGTEMPVRMETECSVSTDFECFIGARCAEIRCDYWQSYRWDTVVQNSRRIEASAFENLTMAQVDQGELKATLPDHGIVLRLCIRTALEEKS